MTMEPLAIAQNLGGVALFALVVWFMWRQHRADKSGIDAQTDATAIALLKEMREERSAERAETREELGRVRERVAILEDRETRQAAALQRHAAWDVGAMTLLRQQGDPAAVSALGDPPPLYPQGG